MQRQAPPDDAPHRIDEGERRPRKMTLGREIDEVERPHARDLGGPRRRERAAAGRDGDEVGSAAPRFEEPGACLDLDYGAVAECRDLSEKIVIAEHGAREEHARKPAIDRAARLVDARDANATTLGRRGPSERWGRSSNT